MLKLSIVSLAVLLLAACESQQAPRDLAANAAINTAQLAATLNRIAASERSVAKKRASTLAAYDRAVRESKAALAFDLAITEKSGDDEAVKFLEEIGTWIAEAESAAAVEGGSAAEHAADLLKQQQDINDKAKKLAAIAKVLNGLAKKQTIVARIAFLAGYFEEVHSLLKANEKTAADAEI